MIGAEKERWQVDRLARFCPKEVKIDLVRTSFSNRSKLVYVSRNNFSVLTAPGPAEIIYVINNSSGGELSTGRRVLNRSLNSSDGKIGAGRPLHIRTDLLPAGLVEDVSCGGGGGGGEEEVVEEEVVVGGEVEFAGQQPGEEEITFIEQEEEHKREEEEEETVTVYEVVGDEEECDEEEWVADGLENGEVNESGGDVEEMVFEEEGEQVIYVTDDGHPVEGDVTFMQVCQQYKCLQGSIKDFLIIP